MYYNMTQVSKFVLIFFFSTPCQYLFIYLVGVEKILNLTVGLNLFCEEKETMQALSLKDY